MKKLGVSISYSRQLISFSSLRVVLPFSDGHIKINIVDGQTEHSSDIFFEDQSFDDSFNAFEF